MGKGEGLKMRVITQKTSKLQIKYKFVIQGINFKVLKTLPVTALRHI